MQKISLIFILNLAVLFFSCKSRIENVQTKTIDSLLVALNNAEETLEKIEFEKLEESAKIAAQNLEKIKPLILDTLNRDKVFLMSNYAIVGGEEEEEEMETGGKAKGDDYEEVREKYIEKELELCKKQLKNLKNDFSKGEMDEPTFKKYFEVEKDKSLQIISFIEMEKNSHAYRLALFDSLHPLILKFLDSLQTVSIKK